MLCIYLFILFVLFILIVQLYVMSIYLFIYSIYFIYNSSIVCYVYIFISSLLLWPIIPNYMYLNCLSSSHN